MRLEVLSSLALDHVDQTFVIQERPGNGALDLFVDISTDFHLADVDDGIELRGEYGSVHYGRACVRHADGSKVALATSVLGQGIQIHIGAEILAKETFPLVIDPVVSTYSVDLSVEDQVESDLSYDFTTDRHLIAYEEIFSATDGDVFAQLRTANGLIFLSFYLDNSPENWRSPQTANLNVADQFLCVAQANNVSGSAGWVVRGRTITAGGTLGAKFNISTTDQAGDKVLPDVGGDPYLGTAYYCVTWQCNFNANDTDIHARLVDSNSNLVGSSTLLIDNSGASLDSLPSISKTNGQLGNSAAWTIVWHRSGTPNGFEVHAARLRHDGVILNPATTIVSSPYDDYYPRVSTPLLDGRVLVVFARHFTDNDLFYALLTGTNVDATGNLTLLDSPQTQSQNQIEYSVDSDGSRFVVAYTENYGTSTFDYDVWATVLAPFGAGVVVTEPHTLIDYSSAQSTRTDIVSDWSCGGFGERFRITWDNTPMPGIQHNIYGADFVRPRGGTVKSVCAGDGSGTACPCGNSGFNGNGCAHSSNVNGANLATSGQSQTGLYGKRPVRNVIAS